MSEFLFFLRLYSSPSLKGRGLISLEQGQNEKEEHGRIAALLFC